MLHKKYIWINIFLHNLHINYSYFISLHSYIVRNWINQGITIQFSLYSLCLPSTKMKWNCHSILISILLYYLLIQFHHIKKPLNYFINLNRDRLPRCVVNKIVFPNHYGVGDKHITAQSHIYTSHTHQLSLSILRSNVWSVLKILSSSSI